MSEEHLIEMFGLFISTSTIAIVLAVFAFSRRKGHCTHCGLEARLTSINWRYEAFAPPINYPEEMGFFNHNRLCDECRKIVWHNWMTRMKRGQIEGTNG